MTVTRKDIYAGAVTLVKIGGTDIGGMIEGVTIRTESEYFDTLCDQVKGVVDTKLTGRKCLITFSMAEISLVNLQKAMAQPAANLSGSTLYLTDGQQAATTLEIQVPTPDAAGTRIYYFLIVRIIGSGEHSYRKDGQLMIAVEIVAFPDTAIENRFGYVYDV